MSGSQVKRLVKDMKTNGFDVNEPIDAAIVNGKVIIIDGHHRAEEQQRLELRMYQLEYTMSLRNKVINFYVKLLKQE